MPLPMSNDPSISRDSYFLNQPRNLDRIVAAAIALAALGLYIATLLPGVGSGDTAEFQRVLPTLGVAHPTGYPLYTILGWLWSLLPHTHVRGKRWIYEATFPDGRKQTLLSVPNYDFDWQTDYIYKEPIKLPKGTIVHATAWYDNSAANKSNPDPTKDVRWGDPTYDEMMIGWMDIVIENPMKPKVEPAGKAGSK